MTGDFKLSRNGTGAIVTWAFLAGFAYAVWQAAIIKNTLDIHGAAIIRMSDKLDSLFPSSHSPHP